MLSVPWTFSKGIRKLSNAEPLCLLPNLRAQAFLVQLIQVIMRVDVEYRSLNGESANCWIFTCFEQYILIQSGMKLVA